MNPKENHTFIMIAIAFLLLGIAVLPKTFNSSISGYTVQNSNFHINLKNQIFDEINACIDSDTLNIYEKGYVKYGDLVYYDTCFNKNDYSYKGDYVVENYCQNDKHYKIIKLCGNSCFDGVCQ